MEKRLDLTGQMILSAIPVILPQIYAFHKIKKAKKGGILLPLLYGNLWIPYGLIMLAAMISQDVFGMGPSMVDFGPISGFIVLIPILYPFFFVMYILIPLYFGRKWTIEYNAKLSNLSTDDENK